MPPPRPLCHLANRDTHACCVSPQHIVCLARSDRHQSSYRRPQAHAANVQQQQTHASNQCVCARIRLSTLSTRPQDKRSQPITCQMPCTNAWNDPTWKVPPLPTADAGAMPPPTYSVPCIISMKPTTKASCHACCSPLNKDQQQVWIELCPWQHTQAAPGTVPPTPPSPLMPPSTPTPVAPLAGPAAGAVAAAGAVQARAGCHECLSAMSATMTR